MHVVIRLFVQGLLAAVDKPEVGIGAIDALLLNFGKREI